MRGKIYPSLINTAENMTQTELFQVPELSTLVALDATLMAAMSQIEFNNPCPKNSESEISDIADRVEEHLVDSILILARALRSTLSAYYAAIQENCDYPTEQQDIEF